MNLGYRVWIVTVAVCLASHAAKAQAPADEARLHLRWSGGSVSILGVANTGAVIDWPESAGIAGRDTIELYDAGGLRASIPVRVPTEIFHCLPDPDTGELSGGSMPSGDFDFSVRVPFDESVSTLRYVDAGGAVKYAVDAKSLPKSVPKMTWPINKMIDNGPDDRRLVFAVLAEGYRASEIAQFHSDAATVMNGFLNEPPWDEYAGLVNVYTVDVESNESGADHPAQSTFVDTALDGSYNFPPIERLLTVSHSKAFQAAASVPSFDLILVIVNDPQYGGAGGTVSTVSVHSAAVGIGVHEMGHTFAHLADEYTSNCPSCGTNPTEPNVTDETSFANIKWNVWIEGGTPLPTPDTPTYSGIIGAFEGAKYQPTGVYRPKRRCLMKSIGDAFCEVCAEAHILELYDTPGIDPIEATTPDASQDVGYAPGELLGFSVTPVPLVSGTFAYSWEVDGVPQSGASSSGFVLNTTGLSGGHTVTAHAMDTTPAVRNDPGGLLTDSVTWTLVEGEGGGGDIVYEIGFPAYHEEGDRVEMTLPAFLGDITAIQWYRKGQPLVDGGRVSGAQTKTLVIDPIQLGDTGNFSVSFVQATKAAATVPTIPIVVYAAGSLPALGAVGLGVLAGAILVGSLLMIWRRNSRRDE